MSKEKITKKLWFKLCVIFVAVILFIGAVLGVLQLGCVYTEKSWEHWKPSYEKTDIKPLLYKTELTQEEYQTLYYQTGFTKLAIDDLRSENQHGRILEMQEFLFEEHELIVDHFAPFTYIEEIDGYAPMAILRDGDIIVSATTRVSWWRYGHAALVTNGKGNRIVESLSPGINSEAGNARSFADFENFMILRPKADEEIKAQVVEYAEENLINLPYQMTTGIFSRKKAETIKRTQCAHLVWHSYYKFGIDLDSNGGLIVKPQDIALSEHVEVVQAFGFNLETLWS